MRIKNLREGQFYMFVDDRIALDKNKKYFILDLKKIKKATPKAKSWLETLGGTKTKTKVLENKL